MKNIGNIILLSFCFAIIHSTQASILPNCSDSGQGCTCEDGELSSIKGRQYCLPEEKSCSDQDCQCCTSLGDTFDEPRCLPSDFCGYKQQHEVCAHDFECASMKCLASGICSGNVTATLQEKIFKKQNQRELYTCFYCTYDGYYWNSLSGSSSSCYSSSSSSYYYSTISKCFSTGKTLTASNTYNTYYYGTASSSQSSLTCSSSYKSELMVVATNSHSTKSVKFYYDPNGAPLPVAYYGKSQSSLTKWTISSSGSSLILSPSTTVYVYQRCSSSSYKYPTYYFSQYSSSSATISLGSTLTFGYAAVTTSVNVGLIIGLIILAIVITIVQILVCCFCCKVRHIHGRRRLVCRKAVRKGTCFKKRARSFSNSSKPKSHTIQTTVIHQNMITPAPLVQGMPMQQALPGMIQPQNPQYTATPGFQQTQGMQPMPMGGLGQPMVMGGPGQPMPMNQPMMQMNQPMQQPMQMNPMMQQPMNQPMMVQPVTGNQLDLSGRPLMQGGQPGFQ